MDFQELEVRSVTSRLSRSSTVSSISVAAARAHAKTEAAQVRAAFELVIELRIEKAHLEALLDVLEKEREAEAALAVAAENLEMAEIKLETQLLPVQNPQK
ncbi:hypothetical protein XELAEV_18035014mg [Xenopus laevis]|uniref:Uncharacterized protein n=1 Tax=Xenopus laevis TaxID=8355 RepID=A0A974CG69_XENLA|nr:hypothetical protein XELAEV_18035014mg [Xenopus laevis]